LGTGLGKGDPIEIEGLKGLENWGLLGMNFFLPIEGEGWAEEEVPE
jgi:hypothetical protein